MVKASLEKAWAIAQENGVDGLIGRSSEFVLRNLYFTLADDPRRMKREATNRLLEEDDIRICLNDQIPTSYDPEKRNILIATESPAVVEEEDWLSPSMEFQGEISFGNFYDLDNYYCPRSLYAGRDSWVRLSTDESYEKKSKLLTIVYSSKTELPGQQLRHDVADTFNSQLDTYGSGAGRYIDRKAAAIEDHMFQIVIENAKYNEYVSEKFFDPLKTMTVPIYRGGEQAVRKLGFDTDGIIFFDTEDELAEIIDEISEHTYREMRPHVENNRQRLIEIRNDLKYEQYLGVVRPGFLTCRTEDGIDLHLGLE